MKNLSFFALIALMACKGDDKGSGDSGDLPVEDLDGDGYSPADGDCDDANALVSPGTAEVYCDDIDNDCKDGDDNDADGDGSDCFDDCDDDDGSVYPGAEDACGDKVDSDCGGELECDCDGDTYDGTQCSGSDCDDLDAAINPDATDACYDGFDSNCDSLDDYDCDRDDHVSAEYGGDDCDDENYEISPSDLEICADSIDNDCNPTTLDCDCDSDGFEGMDCGGEDCDDANVAVNPGASEADVNGEDDDCDGDVDEDGYCNVYMPTSNGSAALLSYVTLLVDGTTYTETQTIDDWDAGTGDVTFARALNSALSSYNIDEYRSCVDGTVTMSGFKMATSGYDLFNATYSEDRLVLLPEDEMIEGASWAYSYEADDATLGLLWTVAGTATVVGTETIEVTAGTFDALVVDYEYEVVETGLGGTYSRVATTTAWYVSRLGVVYSIEVDDRDRTVGERELTAYEGYYP